MRDNLPAPLDPRARAAATSGSMSLRQMAIAFWRNRDLSVSALSVPVRRGDGKSVGGAHGIGAGHAIRDDAGA